MALDVNGNYYNKAASDMEHVWLESNDEECFALCSALAKELGINRYTLYGCLTNLQVIVNVPPEN